MRSSLETCRCINKTVLKHNVDNEYNDDDNDDDEGDDEDDDDDDYADAAAADDDNYVEGKCEQQGVVDFD